jgi:hypothetical protein
MWGYEIDAGSSPISPESRADARETCNTSVACGGAACARPTLSLSGRACVEPSSLGYATTDSVEQERAQDARGRLARKFLEIIDATQPTSPRGVMDLSRNAGN